MPPLIKPLGYLRDRIRNWRRNRGPKNHHCYVCKADLREFVPYRDGSAGIPPFIRELDLIGSDVDHFNCPLCKCHDRERHLFMFFDRLSLWPKSDAHVLHIAPEKRLAQIFLGRPLAEYIRGDLFPTSPEFQRVDITGMDFPDNHFDMVLCNHVLEHVPDDTRAISELYRVVKPGGVAILQTPFSPILAQSFQDEGINTDERRLRFYGQEDHVRVYGNDLFRKIASAGFTLAIRTHADTLHDLDPVRHGVNPKEPFMCCIKLPK